MSDYFPTEFAIKLARTVSLYPRKNLEDYDEFTRNEKKIRKRVVAIEQHEALSEFQQLSISCDIEKSLVAFHGIDLTEEQEDVLAVIHESTPSWAKGKLVEKILGHVSDSQTSRDTKELSEILIRIIDKDLDGKGGSVVEALIIKTTQRAEQKNEDNEES